MKTLLNSSSYRIHLCLLLATAGLGIASAQATKEQLSEAYGQLPLSFEANQGQTDPEVKFLSRGNGYGLFLTSKEAVLALPKPEDGRRKDVKSNKSFSISTLRMKLVGANPTPRMSGVDELPGKANYFIGKDPAKWRTNVPTYAKVKREGVYPGVDLVYYGNQRQLEYDFLVAPGADPGRIKLSFEGARDVRIDTRGELVLQVGAGEIRQHRPVVYQELAGVRREIAGRYVMKGKEQVGFELGRYDTTQPLVIDPVLVYSTYLGGAGDDYGFGIAVDAAGNAYVTGQTRSLNFPTTPGAFDTALNGSFDAFVTKLNPAGSALVYSTYLGGSSFDIARRIAVDSTGNAYVTGDTWSFDFPTTSGAFDTTYNGGNEDVFVTKLNSAGSMLVYSTFLGGSVHDVGSDITVDSADNAYVTGYTGSSAFPTTPGAFDTAHNGTQDAFVTKFNATGSALIYSTFLSGIANDASGFGIAVDSADNAYVTGATSSPNFPTTLGAFDTTHNGTHDVFVTKLNPAGSALVYSTFLGGTALEYGQGIAVDSAGSAYVAGFTASDNFPTTPGAFDTIFNGGYDAFVTKVSPAGAALVYSTYLGGTANDFGNDIQVESGGSAYLAGHTDSFDFPTTPDAFDPNFNGIEDALITKLNSTGTALVYSTYLGDAFHDVGRGIAIDSAGSAYVAGYTASPNFPTTSGAFDPIFNGGYDAFVTKIGAGCLGDADGDGICGDLDHCLDSDLSPTVVIDGCDSGVPNPLSADGCTISDLIAQHAAGASNHGEFVSSVAHLTNLLQQQGLITGQQKGAIQSCAARSSIGKLR